MPRCTAVADPRRVIFWDITREAWKHVLSKAATWTNAKTPKSQDSRYMRVADAEETWVRKYLTQPEVRIAAMPAVKQIIEETQAHR